MTTRRHGLMRPGPVAKAIALLLTVGMVAGVASTFLAQAGLGMWAIAFAVLLAFGVPVLVLARSNRR